ncbi:hypothetical protein K7432_015889 [Basidiobolus ranarum]|uniref:Uncharacterized protein n=1 Tax=Basidiobolus ranarum TaxID=34480 RepID=A0ABR2WFK8_9FUNG
MRYGFLEKDNNGNTTILRPKLNQKLTLSFGFRPVFVLFGFRESILKWFYKHSDVCIEIVSGTSDADTLNKLTFEFQRIGKFTLTPWRCVIRGTVDQDYDRFDNKSKYPKQDLPIILKSGITFGEVAEYIENRWKVSKNQHFSSFLTAPTQLYKSSEFLEDNSIPIPTNSARRLNRFSLQTDAITYSVDGTFAPPPYTAYSNLRQSITNSQELPSYNSTRIHCMADLETLSILIEQYSRRL